MSQPVLVEEHAFYAFVRLNQPKKRNPLPYQKSQGFLDALEELRQKKDIRSIIVTGNGSSFCSGMDLNGLRALQHATAEENLNDSKSIRKFFEYLRNYPKVLIAAVNGPAVAGGIGLLMGCDIAIAQTSAWLSFSEVRIGFVPALVAVYLTEAIGERRARELLLSARKFTAKEALQYNLIHEVTPDDALEKVACERAKALSKLSPEALRRTKQLLSNIANERLEEALDFAVQANAEARKTHDCQEGIAAFLEKRKPQW